MAPSALHTQHWYTHAVCVVCVQFHCVMFSTSTSLQNNELWTKEFHCLWSDPLELTAATLLEKLATFFSHRPLQSDELF